MKTAIEIKTWIEKFQAEHHHGVTTVDIVDNGILITNTHCKCQAFKLIEG